jgi:hypothetical protein
MTAALRSLRDFFVSLKLTVVLLVLGMVLIFAGTLSQVDLGVWAVQKEFFRSFVAIWHVGRVFIPLPGGYVVGGLLLINLVAAHVYRFKFTGRKSGIFLTHVGLILLLVGELLTGLWQNETNMRIEEGETRNYAESYQDVELAIVDTTDPQFDDVVAIPESRLRVGETIQHPKLPFRVVPKVYYPNSIAQPRTQVANPPPPLATAGALADRYVFTEQPITYKQDDRNVPVVVLEFVGAEGSLGSWLVTTIVPVLRDGKIGWGEPTPQQFTYGGHSFEISLRPTRTYQPFSITLLKFSHDVYPGTDIPKNFSSDIRLHSPDNPNDREVKIYMNNPLRYAGLTFYQASFDGEHTTVLQVVRNPSWLMPYIACSLMALGLVLQFGIHLTGFIRKRRKVDAARA